MGFFSIFSGKSTTNKSGNVSKWERVVSDRLAQTYERREAIRNLSNINTPESAKALLRRFSIYSEPSLDDQEERDQAFQAIMFFGDTAVKPILEYCEKAESLSWPLKILEKILDRDGFFRSILTLLKKHDTEYSRNVEPKNQLISALEGCSSEEVIVALLPFLEDVNETTRYQTVEVLMKIKDERVGAIFDAMLLQEESLRIKNKIQGFEK